MIFPVALALVPLFFLLQSLKILDSHFGLILYICLFPAVYGFLYDRIHENLAFGASGGGNYDGGTISVVLLDCDPAGPKRAGQYGHLQLPGDVEPIHPTAGAAHSRSKYVLSQGCRSWNTSSATRVTGAGCSRDRHRHAAHDDRVHHLPESDPARADGRRFEGLNRSPNVLNILK